MNCKEAAPIADGTNTGMMIEEIKRGAQDTIPTNFKIEVEDIKS
jgi:hypothetical protein